MSGIKEKLPFRHLHAENWRNLGVAAVLALYLTQVWLEIPRLFWFLGADYMAYWSAGAVANHWGMAHIYDLNLVYQIQHWMLFGHALPEVSFAPLPMAYLPVFVLPFRWLALLPPAVSFYSWSAINFVAGVLYLRLFARRIHLAAPSRILFLFVISFPFFQSLYWGQVNILLMIFAGEFIRNLHDHRDVRAGLWLSALLLKPQTLIVILPALLVGKKFRALVGAALGAGGIFGASLALVGAAGMRSLANLWLGFADGIATSGPEAMSNWRMVGVLIDHFSRTTYGSRLMVLPALGTLLFTLYVWRVWRRPGGENFSLLMALTWAATGLVAWHSHAHMAVILIPALLLLIQHNAMPQKLFTWWIFLPPAAYLLGLLGMVFVRDRYLQGLLYGPAQFLLYLLLLIWAARQLSDAAKETTIRDTMA